LTFDAHFTQERRQKPTNVMESSEWDRDRKIESSAASYFRTKKIVQRVSGIIHSAVAATIPGLAVLALYHVHNIAHRIYLLIGLTVSFAIIVKLISLSREVEIFGVTAAYVFSSPSQQVADRARFVAVLVVFVGSPATV
jgi:hypothetical protein